MLSEKQIDSLSRRLERFYGNPCAKQTVEDFAQKHPDATVQQAYENLTHGKGVRKSHLSSCDEGDEIQRRNIPRLSRRKRIVR